MNIKYWTNFSKRKNSTKQPTAGTGTLITVLYKEETSYENPHFIVTGPNPKWTYVEMDGAFYFVDEIINLDNSRAEVICSMDPLATFKSEITSSSQFVLYSASNYDQMIPDGRISSKPEKRFKADEIALTNSYFDATGLYVINILNDEGGADGYSATYILNSVVMTHLTKFANSTLLSDATLTSKIKNMFVSPESAIVRCFWLPLSYTKVVATAVVSAQQIRIANVPVTYDVGGTPTALNAYKLVSPEPLSDSGSISITTRYSDFRRCEPFTTASIFLPFYGLQSLNITDFPEDVEVNYRFDLLTGDTVAQIASQKTVSGVATINTIATIDYNIAVNIPITATEPNTGALSAIGGFGASLISAIGTLVGNGSVAAIAGRGAAMIVSGANAAAQIMTRKASVKGSYTGRSMLSWRKVYLYQESCDTTNPADLTNTCGRPLMDYVSLSTLSGFCQCDNASIAISGMSSERDAINSFLNGGFYIE